jgi:hypothetical protein
MIIPPYYCWVVLCTVKDIEETRDHVSDPIRSHTARISVCNTLNTVGRIKYHSKGVALKFLIKKEASFKGQEPGIRFRSNFGVNTVRPDQSAAASPASKRGIPLPAL